MGTEFSGVRTSSTSATETRQVRLVHDRIFLYAPQYTPILMLKGGIMPGPNGERLKIKGFISSKFAPAKKVEWFDKELPSVTAYMAATLAASSSSVSATIDDGSGNAHKGVYAGVVLRMGEENVFVTAYNTTTKVATIVRAVGSTTVAEHVNEAVVNVMSSAVEENSSFQQKRGVQANPNENYMQIFRHDWAVSRSAERIRTYGGKDKAETMAEAATEHVREIERQLTFGFSDNSLSLNSLLVQTMGGLAEFNDGVYKTDSSTGRFAGSTHDAAIDYGEFVETFLIESFKYSSPRRRKTFIGGSVWGKVFGRFSTNVANIQSYTRDTAFGVNVVEVISPAGTIEFLTSGAIEDIESGIGFCFDPEFIQWKYVDNTFMVDNAQPKGTDGIAGYFLTEATAQFEAIKTITAVNGVTGWAAE